MLSESKKKILNDLEIIYPPDLLLAMYESSDPEQNENHNALRAMCINIAETSIEKLKTRFKEPRNKEIKNLILDYQKTLAKLFETMIIFDDSIPLWAIRGLHEALQNCHWIKQTSFINFCSHCVQFGRLINRDSSSNGGSLNSDKKDVLVKRFTEKIKMDVTPSENDLKTFIANIPEPPKKKIKPPSGG